MKQRRNGIILLVLGLMATLGGAANGTLAALGDGVSLSEAVTVILMVGCIVAGITLLIKSKKK